MQRAYDLLPQEKQQSEFLRQQHQETLARVGAAHLELEAAKTLLTQIEQQSRTLVQTVAGRHGVERYLAARIDEGNLICRFADVPPLAADGLPVTRVNGAAEAAEAKE